MNWVRHAALVHTRLARGLCASGTIVFCSMSRVETAVVSPTIAGLGGVVLMLCLSSGASGQKMSAGLVVGRSLTHGFRDVTYYTFAPPPEPGAPWPVLGTRFWSPSGDHLVGGMLELRLNPHWSLEANGLFRQINGRVGHFWPPHEVSPGDGAPNPVVTWQFPVMAKYRFRGRRIKPFVAAGPSFRTAGNLNANDPSHHGIAAGAGLELKWRTLKIAPSVRYTLWAADRRPQGSQTGSDQVEFLVGFSRASEENWRPLGRRVSLGFTLGANVTGDWPTIGATSPPEWPADWAWSSVTYGARSLIYGPTVEVDIWHRFAVEVGALHRPIGRTELGTSAVYGRIHRGTSRDVTWVFPVLAKYRFAVRGPAPFIALGPSFRMRQSLKESSPYGLAAAVGLEMRVGPMKIAPAFRYTRWGTNRLPGWPRRNQTESLVGFSF